jgi:glycosyltransferase involved in cell wall biosynthesis
MDIIKETQNPWYTNYFLKKTYNKANKITVISNEQKRFVEKVCRRKDIIVIFQGTDEKCFSPKNYDKQIKKKYNICDRFLLTVSRLNKRKNIGDQIKALSVVIKKFPKAKLLIVGKGEEKNNLKKVIKKMGLEKNVIFTGYISEKELLKLYATADIFVLTSKYEGFGIANCEALASGTPVITYDTSAARDFIIEGKTGFITKHDYREFAKRIISLLSNTKLLKSMSKEGRKIVEKKYTWDLYAKKHKEVFDKLVGE